ncbi:MAG: InlB B-repeat-containing protein [Clostridia bacterium]|nr:InlB B-repeat-containing protein [Clostridia bacterium]
MKRILSLFLSVLMIFSIIPLTIFAKEDNKDFSVETSDYEITGTNSFGDIMSDALNEYRADDTGADNRILDTQSSGNTVSVSVSATDDCKVAVGAYDEDSDKLVASGTGNVSAGESTVDVRMNKNLPEHYILRSTLLDGNNDPVGEVYTDDHNTTVYEEFNSKTTDDFAGHQVLDLDGDSKDNFAVFNSEVVILNDDSFVSADERNGITTYTFARSEDTGSISNGDVFAYNTEDVNEMVVEKVVDVKESADTVTFTVEDAKMDEAFCFVKIHVEMDDVFKDADSASQEAKLTPVNPKLKSKSAQGGDTYSKTLPFSKGPFSGSVTLTAGFAFVLEYEKHKYAVAALAIMPSASVHAQMEYKTGRKTVSIAEPSVWVYGIEFKFAVKLVYEASAKISFDASISAKFGFTWTLSSGFRNNSSKPVVRSSVQIEGHFYLGLQLQPSVSLLGCARLKLTGEAGAQLNAVVRGEYETGRTEKHDCGALCIAGDVDVKINVDAGVQLGIWDWTLVDKTWNVYSMTFDNVLVFHYSIKYNEFDWGPCQHYSHYITVKVTDESGKLIPNAKVDGKATSGGILNAWYTDGQHILTVSASGFETTKFGIGVDSAKTYFVKLVKGSSSTVREEYDGSYTSYKKRSSSGYGGGGGSYLPPLTYTEPREGVILSTALAGQRRSDVAWVQRELKNLGYNIEADGYYGYRTEAVVRQFQADYSLPVTGKVNANVVAIIKHPIKQVGAPSNIKLTTPAEIASGGIATVTWDAATNATAYDVFVYNSAGAEVDNEIGTKSTVCSFVLYEPGSYTIKIRAKNDRFTGTEVALGTAITVRSKIVVTFLDWDGTLLSKQFVEYGKGAVTPAAPERDGHTFLKWDKDYSKLTENTEVHALYAPNQYTVTFLNTDGNVLSSSKCTFLESAAAPDESQITVPAGCKFIGWDRDFSSVTEDITVKPVVQYENDDLPIIIESYTVARDENYGYNISVTVRNYDKKRTNGRVVAALKTSDNRFVTMTESSAFTLAKSNFSTNTIQKTTLEIFVPCKEDIAYIDLFVVAAYDALIPVSAVARYDVAAGTQTAAHDPAGNAANAREISGTVDSSLSGKQAILFVYKKGDAADFTNEFIDQTVIGADGSYSFGFVLREEPDFNTGDFTVVLGIEGAKQAIFLDKIEAPKPIYTVTFKDYNGKVLSTQNVVRGNSASLPTKNPERTGYTFAGWDYSNSSIYEDLTITAIYVPIVYTVVFIDWTNKRFDMEEYRYGERLIAPDLTSPDDYNAIGWEDVAENTVVTRNMVITARYEKKTYTVKFYDYNNNVIDEQIVEYGDEAVAPELEDDAGHVFYEWDQTDLDDIKKSLDVHPRFRYAEDTATPTASLNSGIYTDTVRLSFADTTDNAIIFYSVNNGDFAEYKAPVSISATSEVSYYATSLGKNDSEVATGYYVINRAEDEANWKYPVSVFDGDERIGVYLLPAGSAVSSGTIHIDRSGYTFGGFFSDRELKKPVNGALTSSATVYAKFVPVQYTVTFKDADGNIIETQNVDYLEAAVPPDEISVPSGYIFAGWDNNDFYCVTQDLEVSAVIADEKTYAKITLDRNTYTMMEGYSHTLTATVQGAEGMEVFWQSDDETVATVDAYGRVTALSEGIAVITATILEKGIADNCYITVTANPEMSVKLNEGSKYASVDGYIIGVSPSDNSVASVRAQIETQDVRFILNGQELSDGDIVTTGTKVILYNGEGNILDEKIIVVAGDVDGDGYAGISDASRIARSIIGREALDGCYLRAADVNGDESINNRDVSLVMRYNVNKESI